MHYSRLIQLHSKNASEKVMTRAPEAALFGISVQQKPATQPVSRQQMLLRKWALQCRLPAARVESFCSRPLLLACAAVKLAPARPLIHAGNHHTIIMPTLKVKKKRNGGKAAGRRQLVTQGRRNLYKSSETCRHFPGHSPIQVDCTSAALQIICSKTCTLIPELHTVPNKTTLRG